jgi:formylglycine-generating enzyme required for sulfatase activity
VEVPRNIFFSRDELTAEQLARFVASIEGESSHRFVNRGPDDQEVRMGFFMAAAYCNWLSEKEGIPEDQWCYLPNRDGRIGPGMMIADNPLRRSGYQIPTADLWEYACRGGASTPRSFGVGIELSSRFVRWSGTSPSNRQKSTARLPNGFGLVDMLGNGAEWSTSLVDGMMDGPNRRPEFGSMLGGISGMSGPGEPPRNQEGQRRRPRNRPGRFRTGQPGMAFGGGPMLIDSAGKTIERSNQFAILGGAFDSPAHKIRCSDRSIISPTMTNKPVTLRLMRIIHEK